MSNLCRTSSQPDPASLPFPAQFVGERATISIPVLFAQSVKTPREATFTSDRISACTTKTILCVGNVSVSALPINRIYRLYFLDREETSYGCPLCRRFLGGPAELYEHTLVAHWVDPEFKTDANLSELRVQQPHPDHTLVSHSVDPEFRTDATVSKVRVRQPHPPPKATPLNQRKPPLSSVINVSDWRKRNRDNADDAGSDRMGKHSKTSGALPGSSSDIASRHRSRKPSMTTAQPSSSSSIATSSLPVQPSVPSIPSVKPGFQPGLSKGQDILDILVVHVPLFKAACLPCLILGKEIITPHDTEDCLNYMCFGPYSLYRDIYRRELNCYGDRRPAACYTCWAPKPFSLFGHGNGVGGECHDEFNQIFWRACSFLVWYCPVLRKIVFTFLGIDLAPDVDLDTYKEWLCQRAVGWAGLPNFTLLVMALLHVYAHDGLAEHGELQLDEEVFVSVDQE
ncbi:hypothetical protein H0H93_012939 [Arthromyces matolae]|nr:hypothetical protein H0H93_012939 [Arthromyces matolae]